LNVHGVNDIMQTEIHTAESLVHVTWKHTKAGSCLGVWKMTTFRVQMYFHTSNILILQRYGSEKEKSQENVSREYFTVTSIPKYRDFGSPGNMY
jgi:hypothetical protein